MLPPATCAIAASDGAMTAPRRYWRIPVDPSPAAGKEELQAELSAAVDMHLVSDVPLGIFLSGGIDSNAIAALAARTGTAWVRPLPIGVDEPDCDGAPEDSTKARTCGTEQQE